MAEIISAVYKITNTVTKDFYIGSSKDVKHRWAEHKCPSTWNRCPNNKMYLDMKKYGTNKFDFQVIAEVKPASLKEAEQRFIELLKPTYNSNRANGWDIERYKETNKKYKKEYMKEYEKSDKRKKYKKEYMKEYEKSDKRKKYKKEYNNKYHNQLCCYNGETLTLKALYLRFYRAGIAHPTVEAKKYLVL